MLDEVSRVRIGPSDDSGEDMTEIIQMAINLAQVSGLLVYIEDGYYKIRWPLASKNDRPNGAV